VVSSKERVNGDARIDAKKALAQQQRRCKARNGIETMKVYFCKDDCEKHKYQADRCRHQPEPVLGNFCVIRVQALRCVVFVRQRGVRSKCRDGDAKHEHKICFVEPIYQVKPNHQKAYQEMAAYNDN
jgi:hypothetical protein